MEIKILLENGIIFLGICLFIISLIFLISTFFKIHTIQRRISPLIDWINNLNISLGELVQSITSIFALLITLYALTTDSIRDNDSSIRYSESVEREKPQHLEIKTTCFKFWNWCKKSIRHGYWKLKDGMNFAKKRVDRSNNNVGNINHANSS